MRIFFRHFAIALLPLVCGLAASWGFAYSLVLTRSTCGRLVGPLFAPKCHWVQLEYQLGWQMAGTALGCLLATWLGTVLELRRRRVVQRADSQPGEVT